MVKAIGRLLSLWGTIFHEQKALLNHKNKKNKQFENSSNNIMKVSNNNDIGTIWNGPIELNNIVPSIASNDDDDDSDANNNDVSICFRNLTNETLLLCWIDEDGEPHHFYELFPYSQQQQSLENSKYTKKHDATTTTNNNNNNNNDLTDESVLVVEETDDNDHMETSCCGHVFIVAQSDHHLDQCIEEKSLQHATIIGAYRPDRIISKNQNNLDKRVHMVTIHKNQQQYNTRNNNNNQNQRPTLLNTFQRLRRGCCFHPNINNNDDDSDVDEEYNNDVSSYYLRLQIVKMCTEVIDTTTKYYEYCTVGKCQWPIFIEPNWFHYDLQLKHYFENDIDICISYLPKHCHTILRDILPTPIWINKILLYGPKRKPIIGRGMCFHPEVDWLIENGCHHEKNESIELYNSIGYKHSRKLWGPGGLLLHEFCHAYHHKCIPNGYNNKDIINCYKAAMKDGIYNKVRVKGTQGPYAKAYACENAMEYFAELSTAFLGGITSTNKNKNWTNKDNDEEKNDESRKEDNNVIEFNKWYPFNRQQLREHDPRAYKMLKKVWKVDIVD